MRPLSEIQITTIEEFIATNEPGEQNDYTTRYKTNRRTNIIYWTIVPDVAPCITSTKQATIAFTYVRHTPTLYSATIRSNPNKIEKQTNNHFFAVIKTKIKWTNARYVWKV
jgi:hypothetical protein